jgi:hypothetical protein
MAKNNLKEVQKTIRKELRPIQKSLKDFNQQLELLNQNPINSKKVLLKIQKDIAQIRKNTRSWNKMIKLADEMPKEIVEFRKELDQKCQYWEDKTLEIEWKMKMIKNKPYLKPAEA